MEEQWQVDRARLRTLRQQHPDWSYPELAHHLSLNNPRNCLAGANVGPNQF